MNNDLNIIDLSKNPNKRFQTHQITRVSNGHSALLDDHVVVEEPLAINIIYYNGDKINKSSLSITMRTPGDDFDLVRGFLFTEGIIGSVADISKIEIAKTQGDPDFQLNTIDVYLTRAVQFSPDELTRHFYTSSSCGVCGKSSIDMVRQQGVYLLSKSLQLDFTALHRILDNQESSQDLFDITGGNHVAYLFDKSGDILANREDVGRHNALDKLIGYVISNEKLPLAQYGVLLSGRASFELVQKAWLAGISIMCAVGAPSSLAVSLADEVGMTLVGFLKKDRYNIYTHPFRIKV